MNSQNRNRLTGLENEFMVTRGQEWRGENRLGVSDWHVHTAIFKIDNQQGKKKKKKKVTG